MYIYMYIYIYIYIYIYMDISCLLHMLYVGFNYCLVFHLLVSRDDLYVIYWFQLVFVISYVGFKCRLVFQMLVSRGALWPCSMDDFAMRLLKCVAELWHYSEVFF